MVGTDGSVAAATAATRAGRPQDSSRDSVILDAALELVSELGYERVSMDAVAARAHASKATIYRRWSNKGALVAAGMRRRTIGLAVIDDHGSFRGDLLATMRMMAGSMSEQDMGLLTGVFAGVREDAELAEALRCGMLAEKVDLIAPVFARAAERGEPVHPQASTLFHETAPAVVMHRLMVTGLPADDAFLEHVVDDVLLPILTNAVHPTAVHPQ